MKKAQVAMEQLMVYGIAILIVMLAVGALIYFGVLDLGSLLPDQCTLKGAPIECENYVLSGCGSAAGELQIEIRNKVGKNIELKNIKVTSEEDMVGMYSDGDVAITGIGPSGGEIVANGQISGVESVTLAGCNLEPGSKLKGRLEVDYRVIGSGIDRTAIGTINVKIAS